MAGDGEQHQEMMCTFGTVSFLGSTHSYVEHSILCVVCCQIGLTCPSHRIKHSGSLDGPMNIFLLQGWSPLDNLVVDEGL